MRHRMVAAMLSLIGLLLSIYLTLHRLGVVGPIACGGSGSCDLVQLGPYGALFSIPVAAYGAAGYLALLVVALVGLQEPWAGHRAPTGWLAVISGLGVAFTIYLTYLELFVIHALCRWCVASAALIVAVFAASLAGLRRRRA
jgi:uncharacterized membrane protein